MKIKRSQLRQIIKETLDELEDELKSAPDESDDYAESQEDIQKIVDLYWMSTKGDIWSDAFPIYSFPHRGQTLALIEALGLDINRVPIWEMYEAFALGQSIFEKVSPVMISALLKDVNKNYGYMFSKPLTMRITPHTMDNVEKNIVYGGEIEIVGELTDPEAVHHVMKIFKDQWRETFKTEPPESRISGLA